MPSNLHNFILSATGATELTKGEMIQSLWSGYGEIRRYHLTGSSTPSLVLKHIKLPNELDHPRGWNSDLSHQRKVKSYQVEKIWYENCAIQCDENCPVPKCLGVAEIDGEQVILLEDLDASGYGKRLTSITDDSLQACLSYLAYFHAKFLHVEAKGLWSTGTYWHLETRPDELEALDDLELKKSAKVIDQKLSSSPFQTLVHGDAKLANFCFSEDEKSVAAVDFQYVGGGCGMKDLAYFVGSCLYEEECESREAEILDFYFAELKKALALSDVDFVELEENWRALYP